MTTTEPQLTEPDVPVVPPERLTPRRVRWIRRRRALGRFWAQYRSSPMGMAGLIILTVFVLMALYSVFGFAGTTNPIDTLANPTLEPPSLEFPMGTDNNGVSVLNLVIQGSKTSLLVGLVASVISMVVGTLIGLAAGYRGGWIDASLMRFTDAFIVIPWLALAIVLAALLGQNLWIIIMIIGLTSWPGTARLVRAQVLSVKERQYVERSRALGGEGNHVVTKHVLPNVMPVIFANTILTIAIAILSESALSFLGLGDPLNITWGPTIEQAFSKGAITIGAWWWLLFPSACIVLVVLAATMIGFAFDEIVNPRIRER
jgi:peptide/nickel transport system permease protein